MDDIGTSANMEETIEMRIEKLSAMLHGQREDGIRRFLVGHDGLLDALIALFNECNKEEMMKNKHVMTFVQKYRSTVKEIQRLRISVRDFEVKDTIGRGHFGEVQVVREAATGIVYAMKTLRKSETLSQPDIAFFEEERDIMAQAASPWITQLHYAFQDEAHLYLVMEFHPGGDLLSLLARFDDVFEEKMARFYLAEVSLAINDLHSMGYVHRDIKPENVLVDRSGHIKLADFGSAAKLARNRMVSSKMPVGTPDYVSPELLVAMNSSDGMSKYGVEVDWWSLGICAYEMLYGKTPFTDDNGSMVTTYSNIMNFKNCLSFPKEPEVSDDAVTCVKSLLAEAKQRAGFKDLCCHPFFSEMDFQHLRDKTPPVVPTVNGQDDTSNFDEFEKVRPKPSISDFRNSNQSAFNGKDLPFVGFTYTKELFSHSVLSPFGASGDATSFSYAVENPVQSCVGVRSSSTSTATSTTATVTTSGSPSCSNLEVKLTVKIQELQSVKERCHQLEETECSLKSHLQEMEQSFRSKDEELKVAELSRSTLENDLEKYIHEIKKLRAALDDAMDGKRMIEARSQVLFTEVQKLREEMKLMEQQTEIDDRQLRSEAEEVREVNVRLEADHQHLSHSLARKQKQLDTCTAHLEAAQKRIRELQATRDKERRKSREVWKQDFERWENGEQFWKVQAQEKVDQVDGLKDEIQTLQTEVERYRCEEKRRCEEEQRLRDRLTLLDTQNKELIMLSGRGSDRGRITELEAKLEARDQQIKELHDAVTMYKLKEGQYQQESRNDEKIKEIIDRLDKHRIDERTWKRKERELNEKIKDLENRLDLYRSKGLLGAEPPDGQVYDRLSQYQQEVQEQKKLIRDLKDKVQRLIDNEKKTSSKEAVLQITIKELEEQVSSLQTERRALLEKGDKHRQKLDDKERSLTEHEGTISSLNMKVSQLERQIKELNNRQREDLTNTCMTPKSLARERLEARKLANLKEENSKLELKVCSLERQVERGKNRSEHTQQRILERKLENAEKDKTDLSETVSRLRKDLLRVKSEKRSKVDSEACSDAAELKLQVEKLQAEVEELRSQLRARETDLVRLENTVKGLEEELEAVRSGNKENETAESVKLKGRVKQLRAELEDTKSDNQKWQSETMAELRSTVRQLRQELAETKASKDSMETAEITQLNNRIIDLTGEIEALKSKFDDHEMESSENDQLKADIEELKDTIRQLREELKESKSQSEDKMETDHDVVTSGQFDGGKVVDSVQLKGRVKQLRAELEDTKSDNRKWQSETMTELRSTIRQLRQELGETKASKDSTQSAEIKQLNNRIKDLTDEIENLKSKLDEREMQSNENNQHQAEIDQLRDTIRLLREELEKSKSKNDDKMETELEVAHSERFESVKNERDELEARVVQLEEELAEMKKSTAEAESAGWQKSSNQGEVSTVNVDFTVTVKDLAQEYRALKESQDKTGSGYRYSARSKFSDLKQYNAFLETRLEHVQKLLDEAMKNSNGKYRAMLENQVKSLTEERAALTTKLEEAEEEMKELRRRDRERAHLDGETVKQEKGYLETKVKKLEEQVTELRNQNEISQDEVTRVQEQLQQTSSVSEGRVEELEQRCRDYQAQVASLEAKERALQAQLDGLQKRLMNGVRDIEDKLQQAQLEKRQVEEFKDQAVREKEVLLHQLERELQLTKSQHEKSSRQYQELQGRVDDVARVKCQVNMELETVKGELATRNHQLELETKKVAKLKMVCVELEAQIVDLETLTDHYEKKEADWNKIRHKYEQAVDEREEKLEGTNHRLASEQKAKQVACDKVKYMKQKLDNCKAMQRMELDSLTQQLNEAHCTIEKLNSRVGKFEETSVELERILKTQKDNMIAEANEQIKLKEEISRYITENQTLRGANLKLTHNLEEAMDKFELIFGEKVDLENIMEKLQGWHFLEKYRYESHSEQLFKLIDYLQTKKETSKKKNKFSFKSKDTAAGGVPMQWKELNTALETERKRCVKLQEQVDKLRQENFKQSSELLQLKGPMLERVPSTNVPCTPINRNTVSAITNSPSSQLSPIPLLTPRVSHGQTTLPPKTPQPAKQRMHHKIPHKFIKGLNTRATKCAVCLGSVHFVKQATKCQECRLVIHPKCQPSVQATCGLPTEYVQHFAEIMESLKSTEPNQLYPTLELEKSVKMQGWLKIGRSSKPVWERKWVRLEGSLLMMYQEESDASPMDTFDLNPPNAEVTVHSAVTTAELSSTVGTDLAYILRLDMTPHTTCWPGRTLYLMATNFSDKQRWGAMLEAAVSTCTSDKENRTSSWKLCGFTEVHLEGDKKLELNCCLVLTREITLLGAEEGLFAYSPNCGHTGPVLVRFGGLDNVYQLTYVPALHQVLLITGKQRQILSLDKRVIEAKMREGKMEECVVIPSQVVEGTHGCTVFDVGSWNHAHYLCVGMAEKVVLMKYSSQQGAYIAKKDFNAPEPCSCICVTNNYAIVGTYKFYRIDMEKMAVSEFVDNKDNSLAFAAYGAAVHHSFPLAVVRLTDIGLPEEFLLCFNEFGVFVNAKGRRSRPGDMKWSGLPLGFVYKEPYLYVTYFTSIQAIQIPPFSQELKVRQMHVSLPSPRYLGMASTQGAVYFASTNRHATEVICFGGSESSSPVKPLTFDLHREHVREKERQVKFVSPEVEVSRPLRRSRSSSSLESCSSVYSISTLESLDTDWSPPSKRERLARN